jgi:hypothetical protein
MSRTAIPTEYNGVQFRSRLEARWAAFFDLCGWSWAYEPADLPGWIPDFRLGPPRVDALYLEVKPASSVDPAVYKKINDSARGATDWLGEAVLIGNEPMRGALFFSAVVGWRLDVGVSDPRHFDTVEVCAIGDRIVLCHIVAAQGGYHIHRLEPEGEHEDPVLSDLRTDAWPIIGDMWNEAGALTQWKGSRA